MLSHSFLPLGAATTYALASASGHLEYTPHLQQIADDKQRSARVRLAVHQEANQARGDDSRVLLVEGA